MGNFTFSPVDNVHTPGSAPKRVASKRNPRAKTAEVPAFGKTAPEKPGTYAKSQSAMPLADQAVRTAMAHARKQIGSLDGIGVSWRYRHAM